jgi:hypothetical protein
MSVRTQLDIFCDECGNWEHGDSRSVRSIRYKFHKEGWVTVLKDRKIIDLCPYCSGNKEQDARLRVPSAHSPDVEQ